VSDVRVVTVKFELIGELRPLETIATGHGIRDLRILMKRFGRGNWRKMKGTGTVQFANGTIAEAELHWYEAHGIGRRWLKVKRIIQRL
jgi:hypothetical protein